MENCKGFNFSENFHIKWMKLLKRICCRDLGRLTKKENYTKKLGEKRVSLVRF